MEMGGAMEETERPVLGADTQIPEDAVLLLARYDTHCATQGCPNGEFTIRLLAGIDAPLVTCGGCDNPVTDCSPVE